MSTQVFDPKIPILMYHEISDDLSLDKDSYEMTPMYDISAEIFESHLKFFAENGYKSLLFDDIQNLDKDGKYFILTFDDGLAGNYKYALPILKKYGFRATFFAVAGSVCSRRFMNWLELTELVGQGMSVQSHTLSHMPLQNLNSEEVSRELILSKQLIEENLKTSVTALSCPHGSYNSRIISLAHKAGYRFICTSNIERISYRSFQTVPAVLGRIAATNRMSPKALARIVEYDNYEFLYLKFSKNAKNTFKRIIGVENYRRLYRSFFKIKLT